MTFILVDKNDRIVSQAYLKHGDAKVNLTNNQERQNALSDGGQIIEAPEGDYVTGDKYKDGIHTKDSPLRQEEQNKKDRKEKAKQELKALGLTDDAVKGLFEE